MVPSFKLRFYYPDYFIIHKIIFGSIKRQACDQGEIEIEVRQVK